MLRRLAPVLLALPLVLGCAGPSKLAQRSEQKLFTGEHWRAWDLATRALDKAPSNARARAAAAAAATRISQDWQRRIQALAQLDSITAAEQVLEYVAFRTRAVPYTTVEIGDDWARQEQTLRRAAARAHYQNGVAALKSQRPRRAHVHFTETERYVPGYRDAQALAERSFQKGLIRVAFVPFRAAPGSDGLGKEAANRCRDDMAMRMAPPTTLFTRILGGDVVEKHMTVSQLGDISRDAAIRLGRKAGAERVVWGSVGDIRSDTHLDVFSDAVARRTVEKGPDGRPNVRWIEVPIEVVARVRTATVNVEYEVIATETGTSLAKNRGEHSASARVVWTTYAPVGDLGDYALVSETMRSDDPQRAGQIEKRWKTTCGDNTTLRQVLEARRSARGQRYRRDMLPRLIAGAMVFLDDPPPAEELARAALDGGWKPLQDDLVRLEAIDDVDLTNPMAGEDVRR